MTSAHSLMQHKVLSLKQGFHPVLACWEEALLVLNYRQIVVGFSFYTYKQIVQSILKCHICVYNTFFACWLCFFFFSVDYTWFIMLLAFVWNVLTNIRWSGAAHFHHRNQQKNYLLPCLYVHVLCACTYRCGFMQACVRTHVHMWVGACIKYSMI